MIASEKRTRSKDGLSYGLIFHHGLKEESDPHQRFLTMNQLATEHVSQYGIQDGERAFRKFNSIKKEMALDNPKLSEAHESGLRHSHLPLNKTFSKQHDTFKVI